MSLKDEIRHIEIMRSSCGCSESGAKQFEKEALKHLNEAVKLYKDARDHPEKHPELVKEFWHYIFVLEELVPNTLNDGEDFDAHIKEMKIRKDVKYDWSIWLFERFFE